MHFDLTDLRVFLHTCESGSMTAAAERAHLTLAAVSARIRALEDETGLSLLRRHARGVTATAAGEMLARHARLVLQQVQALQKDLAPDTSPQDHPIVLLGNSSALSRPLAGALAGVLAQHPGARIIVSESGSEVSVHALQLGAADLAIISDATTVERLDAEELGPDPLLVVMPSGHALARHSSLTLRDLLAHGWVGWTEGGALHTHLAMQACKVGRAIHYRVTAPSTEAVLELVSKGIGLSVLPAALLSISSRPLAKVPLDEAWARRRLLLCKRAGLQHTAALALAHAIRTHWQSVSKA